MGRNAAIGRRPGCFGPSGGRQPGIRRPQGHACRRRHIIRCVQCVTGPVTHCEVGGHSWGRATASGGLRGCPTGSPEPR